MFIIKEGTAADKIGEGTSPEVLQSVKDFLSKSGLIIRTPEEDKAFLTNSTQPEIDRVLGERNRQFEDTILETTGVKKNGSEKFYDYHKRAIIESRKEIDELQNKIKDFEKRGVSGSEIAQQLKRDLEAERERHNSMITEYEEKLKAKDNDVFTSRVASEIDKIIAEIKGTIDPTIKPELAQDIIDARLHKFRQENTPYNADGMIVWKDSKTNVTRTSKQDGKPLNAKELFGTYVTDIAGKGRQQGGGGSGAGAGQGGNNGGGSGEGSKKFKDIMVPDTVKTKVQLTDYLEKEHKLDPNTKEFTEAFNGLVTDNMPLR